MAEMSRISRFFVNAFNAPRNARLLRWIRDSKALPKDAVCLEVGCGNADLAARVMIAFHPTRYVATDLDADQISVARAHLARHYRGRKPLGLELRTADMLHLDFPDGLFDAVLAVVAIHHASPNHHDPAEVPRALAEIDRVLRPGGVLIYEEILHKERIRAWLTEHGYALSGIQRRFKRESVVAKKPGGAS